MAIKVNFDPGRFPKNSSNMCIFVVLNSKEKFLTELFSLSPEAERNEVQVNRPEAIPESDCKRCK